MAKKANNENVDVIFSRQSKRKDLIALRKERSFASFVRRNDI